ncbi:MAG TPA: hypothetical protein DEB39_14050 [Planctomycetaceae bacterium]|nr:hypothetical protein [Planctomycetaceae bacterium]
MGVCLTTNVVRYPGFWEMLGQEKKWAKTEKESAAKYPKYAISPKPHVLTTPPPTAQNDSVTISPRYQGATRRENLPIPNRFLQENPAEKPETAPPGETTAKETTATEKATTKKPVDERPADRKSVPEKQSQPEPVPHSAEKAPSTKSNGRNKIDADTPKEPKIGSEEPSAFLPSPIASSPSDTTAPHEGSPCAEPLPLPWDNMPSPSMKNAEPIPLKQDNDVAPLPDFRINPSETENLPLPTSPPTNRIGCELPPLIPEDPQIGSLFADNPSPPIKTGPIKTVPVEKTLTRSEPAPVYASNKGDAWPKDTLLPPGTQKHFTTREYAESLMNQPLPYDVPPPTSHGWGGTRFIAQ